MLSSAKAHLGIDTIVEATGIRTVWTKAHAVGIFIHHPTNPKVHIGIDKSIAVKQGVLEDGGHGEIKEAVEKVVQVVEVVVDAHIQRSRVSWERLIG